MPLVDEIKPMVAERHIRRSTCVSRSLTDLAQVRFGCPRAGNNYGVGRLFQLLAAACALTSMQGCTDPDFVRRGIANELTTVIILKEEEIEWRFTSGLVGACREYMSPRYCEPAQLSHIERYGSNIYIASYKFIARGSCAKLPDALLSIRNDVSALAALQDHSPLNLPDSTGKQLDWQTTLMARRNYYNNALERAESLNEIKYMESASVDCGNRVLSVRFVFGTQHVDKK